MSDTTEERTKEHWRQALDLFEEAQALPPHKRETLLRSAGDRDARLRQTVESLLAAHRETERTEFLETPAISYQPAASDPPAAGNPQALVGQRVGTYQITEYLTQGGMGWVFLGERADGQFRRRVAIKVISPELAGAEDSESFRRFRREMQILADLKHPNLVALYDAGRLDDGRPYIVMEYVQGETLQAWLKRHEPMPLAQVVEVIRQAAAGLDAAHAAGVIHRDIKPGNIILTGTGLTGTDPKPEIKVLDFGIASRQQSGDSILSRTQSIIGTLPYMSPEQLQPQPDVPLTPASDVFALGLVAYELLTGRMANNGQSPAEIIVKQLQETPAPPSQASPHQLPATVDQVVLKALAKEPMQRYQTAPAFATALRQAMEAEFKRHSPPPPPPRWKTIAIAAAIIAVLALSGIYLLWQRRPAAPATDAATNAPTAASSQPAPATSSTAQPESGALEFALDLDAGGLPINQRSYSGCRFALLRPGVATIPAQINAENALVLFEEMRRQYPSPEIDRRVVTKERVKPGRYLVSFTCPGYRTIAGERTVTEQGGLARLRLSLEKE